MASGSGSGAGAGRPSSSVVVAGHGTAPADAAAAAAAEHLLFQEEVPQNMYNNPEVEAYMNYLYVETLGAMPEGAPPEVVPEQFEDLLHMDHAIIDDEVDYVMAAMGELGIRESGHFVLEVLEALLHPGRWLDAVQYLANVVERYAADSVVPAPAAVEGNVLVNIHAELFLSPHRQHVWEILVNGGVDAARAYYDLYLAPLAASTTPGSRVRRLFTDLIVSINHDLGRPQDIQAAAAQASTEIKDYIFLYFPPLRPVRAYERSPMWAFGERTEAANGTKGFRCYSCHRVFNNAKVKRLQVHLLGGDQHQSGCPAVLQCTLDRIQAIMNAQGAAAQAQPPQDDAQGAAGQQGPDA